MNLFILPHSFSICRFAPESDAWENLHVNNSSFISITRTNDELSVVCLTEIAPTNCEKRNDGWRCIGIEDPVDFSMTGVLSKLIGPLTDAKISVFAVATFDTDYILVKDTSLNRAVEVLTNAGYTFRDAP